MGVPKSFSIPALQALIGKGEVTNCNLASSRVSNCFDCLFLSGEPASLVSFQRHRPRSAAGARICLHLAVPFMGIGSIKGH